MVLLYTAFNSMKDALLVMANVVAATMGGVWALKLTRDAVHHLGGRRVHLDLRRRRAGRRAPDLVLQPDARLGPAGPRGGHARGRAAGPPGRHDLADRRPRPAARGPRHLDRLAGPEAAGDRGRRRHARHPVPDPLPDAGALQLLPRHPRRRPAGEVTTSSRARTTPTSSLPSPASCPRRSGLTE